MPAKHYVFTALPAWGHVKSFCTLGARLVKEGDSTIVTMILDARILDKAREEISVELGGKDLPGVGQRIRVLAAGQNDSLDFLEMMKSLAEAYAPAYKALAEGKPVTCAATGTVFDPVIPPSAVILDFFVYPQLQSTRAVTGTSVPVFAWMTGHASSMIRIFGPEELGGAGDWRAKMEAEAARLGVTPESIGENLVRQTDGKIVNIPGLPPMYDYEWYPQKLPFKIPASNARRGCVNLLKECDGVLITTAYAFEPVALEAMKSSWFASWNKPTYVIGPVLPTGFGETITQTPKGANEVQEFLTKALKQHGEKSVLFISFGTFFYPTDLGYLEELLEALIEKEFPFIFCYASPFATMTQELLDKAASSGLGLITKWAPQQYILSHPATGWFVTHCGHNSAMESLACGIPLIAWPFEADQPGAAAHLTENLKVAFELIEVRTGEHGLRPLLRNDRAAKGTREAVGVEIREIIDAARGPRGEQLRKNAQEMQVKFSGAWKEDGSSRKELLKFIADCA